jgi:hypothetical protein
MTDIMEQAGLRAEVLDEADAPSALAVDDQSIYRKRHGDPGFEKTPWSAYFYYVGKAPLDSDDRPVTAYQYVSHHGPIEPFELRQLVTQLALNAREPDPNKQNPKPSTASFKWRRKSYIIMLVDDPAFSFDKDNAISMAEVVSGKNYTFFDGVDFDDIALPGPAGGAAKEYVTAACFINHMKRSIAGDDLRDGEEQRFTAIYAPPIRSAFVRDDARFAADGRLSLDDDSGTNMGPPIGPP